MGISGLESDSESKGKVLKFPEVQRLRFFARRQRRWRHARVQSYSGGGSSSG